MTRQHIQLLLTSSVYLLRTISHNFSKWNRKRKLIFVKEFISSQNIKSCLVVGANANSASAGYVNLVERDIESFLYLRGGAMFASGIEENGMGWQNWIQADGRKLPFGDKSFDLVFSNAVIEHVGQKEDQLIFVREHDRVGKSWIFTTPNRMFPIESHTQVLLIHMSKNWKHPSFSRLLSKRDLLEILPKGTHIKGNIFSPTFICYKFQN